MPLEFNEDDPGDFDDFEIDFDDNDAVDRYAEELRAAVEAFGVDVKEPGEVK